MDWQKTGIGGETVALTIDGSSLTFLELMAVAKGEKVELALEARQRIQESRVLVEKYISEGQVVYGVTTGFGKFADTVVSANQIEELQENLIRSHAIGVGEALSEEIVRAVMVLRANALTKGYSGVRVVLVDTLLELINRGVHPYIPSQGSLGASGDLAPLAHMALVLMGEGKAWYQGDLLPGAEALKRANIVPLKLQAKEGLALINGTQVMTAIGAFSLMRARYLLSAAEGAAALSMEALRGIPKAFDEKIMAVRPHSGQKQVALNMLKLLEGSSLVSEPGELRVQDPYTLRCIPQVLGATADALGYIEDKVLIEMNSATDNPLIFADEVLSGGNFHGQPLAISLDFLGIAIAELGNMSERRIERLVNPSLSGLPAFLTREGGLNSGFMIGQYTAASLVSENKVLSSPASVDSIPSSANQEDHVSMGTIAARKAYQICTNVSHVISIELLAAAQAVDFRDVDGLGKGSRIVYDFVREYSSFVGKDRSLADEVQRLAESLLEGELEKRILVLEEEEFDGN